MVDEKDPRAEPEHIRTPDHPPAFKSELGVDTGIEVGVPILLAGVVACFFAGVAGETVLWIVGGALVLVGGIVLLRNRRL
jgi:hypothetical protein